MSPSLSSLGRLLSKRIRTLKPAIDHVPSPVDLLGGLNRKNWGYFFFGFFVWALDAFDYHTVTISYVSLQNTFKKDATQISLGITCAMMLRPVGAAAFGAAADAFGRKWPFIVNCSLLIVFELLSGFSQTYEQFLAFRGCFGIAMGGLYGNAATTALEDCPPKSRGLLSGMFQSGYPFGYLLAVVFSIAFKNTTSGWRALFWFAACLPVIFIVLRLFMDETDIYKERMSLMRPLNTSMRSIFDNTKAAVQSSWPILIYLIILMTGFSLMSHTTQDLYPFMLEEQYGLSTNKANGIVAIGNVGACLGGMLVGYASEIAGRRLSIILSCIVGATLVYPYAYISGNGVYATSFFEQFCVQGAFGVVPIHLVELSPAPFRTFIVGTAYQMGVLFASPTNTIITVGGRHKSYDYSYVICIFSACIFVFVILVTAVGNERLGGDLVHGEWDHDESEVYQGGLTGLGMDNSNALAARMESETSKYQ